MGTKLVFTICYGVMECIFCKIVAGEIPSVKIRENEQFVAILDAFPACKGQTLVLPKQHFSSDVFMLDDATYVGLMRAVKEVVALMKKGLGVERIGSVIEGLEVDHAHIKLYPFWDNKSFVGGLAGTAMADLTDLQNVADEITGKLNE